MISCLLRILAIIAVVLSSGCGAETTSRFQFEDDTLCIPNKLITKSESNVAGFHRVGKEDRDGTFVNLEIPINEIRDIASNIQSTRTRISNGVTMQLDFLLRIGSKDSVDGMAPLQLGLVDAAEKETLSYFPSPAKGFIEVDFVEDDPHLKYTWTGIVTRQYKGADSGSVRNYVRWNPAICHAKFNSFKNKSIKINGIEYKEMDDAGSRRCFVQLFDSGTWMQYEINYEDRRYLPKLQEHLSLLNSQWRSACGTN